MVDTGTDACFGLGCLPILIMCWSCGRIANAAAGTSTRHLWTCLSALTSAPGAATARRTSWMASVRTAAASSSVVPYARSNCSQSTRHRPSGLSGQDALRHPPADPPIGQQELTAPSSQALAHACGPSHRRAPRESTDLRTHGLHCVLRHRDSEPSAQRAVTMGAAEWECAALSTI